MNFPISVSCRPRIGKDNWSITIYDRNTQEVYCTIDVKTSDIKRTTNLIMEAFANELSNMIDADVHIDIL